MSDDDAPAHWEDLTDEQRKELLAIADARIVSRKAWAGFYGRLERVRGIGTVILTLAAIWTLFGDAIAQGLNSWLNSSK